MYRRFMLVLAFLMVAAALGQLSSGAQSYPGTVTMPAPGTPGTIVVGQVPATPTATLAAPSPTAGISDAGRAGISDLAPMPPNVPVPSSTIVYVTQPPVQTITTAPPGVVPTSVPGAVVETNVAGESVGSPSAANESGGRTVNDLGPSYYADAVPSGNNTSLGEISVRFKALKSTVNARTLTNDDVRQVVDSKSGVTMAKNMPPLGPGALEQSGQAQNSTSQTAQTNSQSTLASSSTNQQAKTGTAGQGGTPPPASATQGNTGSANNNAENATTPQINQNQQSNDSQGSRRLPATATLLPLLGLLGVVSGGIGFWFRRIRK